jgi:hypothetical protein
VVVTGMKAKERKVQLLCLSSIYGIVTDGDSGTSSVDANYVTTAELSYIKRLNIVSIISDIRCPS